MITIAANAKINLRLRVLSQEVSGYHSIETIFQRIALHDIVSVALSSERTITCTGPSLPPEGLGNNENNIAFRAASMFMRESEVDSGFEVRIDKRIPVGGGLGGGSANAAAVLIALQRLYPGALGKEAFWEVARRLGADVPFLATGWSRALAWGRGDQLLQLSPLPQADVHLYAFQEGVSTAAAYQALAASRRSDKQAAVFVGDQQSLSSWSSMSAASCNDFEDVVSLYHGGVRDTLAMLRSGSNDGDIVLMSGSGATCFRIPLYPTPTSVINPLPKSVLIRSSTV